jgi:heat shock protein HslJ
MKSRILPCILRRLALAIPVLSLSLAVPGMAQAASLTARGNEPGWRIEVSDKTIVFQGQDGENFTIEPLPPVTTADGIETYSAKVGDRPFTLTLADNICTDTMSGMPYPKTATVTLGERTLAGCAGEPASLLHGDWRIGDIGGNAVVAQSEPTLSFDLDGSIHGNASCNRFFGHFTLTGEGLSISETGASMMMCDQPLMDQERSLLKAFEAVHRFEVASNGQVRLLGGDDRPLVTIRR